MNKRHINVSVATLMEKVLIYLHFIQGGNQYSQIRGNWCFQWGKTGHWKKDCSYFLTHRTEADSLADRKVRKNTIYKDKNPPSEQKAFLSYIKGVRQYFLDFENQQYHNQSN